MPFISSNLAKNKADLNKNFFLINIEYITGKGNENKQFFKIASYPSS